jgi:hypothetical protein
LAKVNQLSNPIRIFYTRAMPGIAILLILVLPQFIVRPQYQGSGIVDFIGRAFLCLWLCRGYISMPNTQAKYSPFIIFDWSEADMTKTKRVFLIVLVVIYCIAIGFITYWAVGSILPIYSQFLFFIAFINGLIFLVPLLSQYEIFRFN